MISKISGRYISYYADDLAELLLDDFLEETVQELEQIERVSNKTYVNQESRALADCLLYTSPSPRD